MFYCSPCFLANDLTEGLFTVHTAARQKLICLEVGKLDQRAESGGFRV